MYVGPELIAEAERRWGVPATREFRVPTPAGEIAFIRGTQKRGRAHDVTLLIRDGERIAVIAKHLYPAGLFRLPSGGVNPGETLEEGALREGREETGLDLEVTTYLLRASVRFEAPDPSDSIDWTTHVFDAAVRGGELAPEDIGEIREAAWITRIELLGPIRETLGERPESGLQYRRKLHDAVFRELDRRAAEAK